MADIDDSMSPRSRIRAAREKHFADNVGRIKPGSYVGSTTPTIASPRPAAPSPGFDRPVYDATFESGNGQGSSSTIEGPNLDDPKPPQWYSAMAAPNSNNARGTANKSTYPSTIDNTFQAIRGAMTRCEDAAFKGFALPEAELKKINDGIHAAFFARFDDPKAAKAAIRKNRMLHTEDGLPRIWYCSADLKSNAIAGRQLPNYPYYIVADAKELYLKWATGIFDTSLYRGINVGKPKNAKLNKEKSSDRFDPTYTGRRYGKVHGNNRLLNGQWWPNLLCAVRDGAHNSAQAGICGTANEGAWSVVVAGDDKYPDDDQGELLLYCGTAAQQGAQQPTDSTQRMLESVHLPYPVRVIRSFNGKNALYRPRQGYRYDGLYDVVGKQILDIGKHHYRFKLVRVAGQDPVRYQGLGARPTAEELREYEASREERKYLV